MLNDSQVLPHLRTLDCKLCRSYDFSTILILPIFVIIYKFYGLTILIACQGALYPPNVGHFYANSDLVEF